MFFNRYVRTVLFSRVLLQLGVWVRNFAVLLEVIERTNQDPVSVSLISVAEFAPLFLFAAIGGTFADRWRPKRTMIWSDLLSALSAAAVLLILQNGGWIALLFGSFVSASLSQFSQPSAMKLYKRHVPEEQLQSAMAANQTLAAIFTVAGPMIGTFLFTRLGIEASLVLTSFLFLGSSLVLASLPRDEEETKTGDAESVMREMAAGLRYIGSNPSLRTLGLTFAVTGFAAGLIQPLLVFVPVEKLGRDAQFLQWLLTANGAAMLAGGAAVMGIARKIKPQRLLAAGLLINAVCTVGTGASSAVWLTVALQAAGGLFYPCIQIGIQTLIMRNTAGAFIGRVSGAIPPVFMGMMVLGMLLSGFLKGAFSLTSAYAVSGVLLAAGALPLAPMLGNDVRKPRDKRLKPWKGEEEHG